MIRHETLPALRFIEDDHTPPPITPTGVVTSALRALNEYGERVSVPPSEVTATYNTLRQVVHYTVFNSMPRLGEQVAAEHAAAMVAFDTEGTCPIGAGPTIPDILAEVGIKEPAPASLTPRERDIAQRALLYVAAFDKRPGVRDEALDALLYGPDTGLV